MSQSKAFLVCWHLKQGMHKKKNSINWNNIVKQCGAKFLQDYVRDWYSHIENYRFRLLVLQVFLQATESKGALYFL